MTPDPESFLPLKPDLLLILLVLSRRDRHGYGIIRDVESRSEGSVRLPTGALYRSLRGLMADRLILEAGRQPVHAADDDRRRLYRITPLGRAVVDAEVARMARLVRAAGLIRRGRDPRLV